MATTKSRLQTYGLFSLGVTKTKGLPRPERKLTEPELRRKILESWQEIGINDVRTYISAWKQKLRLLCQQSGGPIDHLL